MLPDDAWPLDFFGEADTDMDKAFQDFYADNFSHCYGCGKHNPDGHQLKSYWDGDNTVARYTPKPI